MHHEIAAAWIINGGIFMSISAFMSVHKPNLAGTWAQIAVACMVLGSLAAFLL